jgi:hypothetical protein
LVVTPAGFEPATLNDLVQGRTAGKMSHRFSVQAVPASWIVFGKPDLTAVNFATASVGESSLIALFHDRFVPLALLHFAIHDVATSAQAILLGVV